MSILGCIYLQVPKAIERKSYKISVFNIKGSILGPPRVTHPVTLRSLIRSRKSAFQLHGRLFRNNHSLCQNNIPLPQLLWRRLLPTEEGIFLSTIWGVIPEHSQANLSLMLTPDSYSKR